MRTLKGSLVALAEASRIMTEHEIDESIQQTRESITKMPREDADARIDMLHILAIQLSQRHYKYEGDFALDEAVEVMREVVDATPRDHPELLDRMYLLENRISDKWSETRDLALMDESIRLKRTMVMITDHTEQLEWLAYLAIGLWHRYTHIGVLKDLDEGIELSWAVFEGVPRDAPTVDHIGWCSGLIGYLLERYNRLEAESDIDEAINVSRILLDADFGDGAWLKPGIVDSLARMLHKKYARTGTLPDLEESIRLARQASTMTPTKDSARGTFLVTLADGLTMRYKRSDELADLEEAIKLGFDAIEMTSIHSSTLPELYGSLAEKLREKYVAVGGDLEDLDMVVGIAFQAVEMCPEQSPVFAVWCHVLSSGLGQRYLRTKEASDLRQATDICEVALRHEASMISGRVRAGIAAVVFCEWANDWARAYEVVTLVIPLLSKLMPQTLQQADKRHVVGEVLGAFGFASLTVAVTLNAGKSPSAALKMLEQARGLFATSLEELRTDVIDLRARYPELADRFVSLRNQLDLPSEMVSRQSVDLANAENRGDRRYEAGTAFDELMAQIRELPGFENFLVALTEEEMRDAAQHGPVVVINASPSRCDALLVECSGIRCVRLPQLEIDDIKARAERGDLGSTSTLMWLWDAIAKPVLDALGFTQAPCDDQWPRIWWIPTGPLSKFPLHAAGDHAEGSTETVLDRAMSSYSPSIKALIQSRKSCVAESKLGGPDQALLVSMQETPGYSTLRFANQEIESLKAICQSMDHKPILTENVKGDVVSLLPSCRIFHFAGHGYTDDKDPSQSSLLLQDWKHDRFTVSTLLELNLRANPLFLAYLSACGTGEVENERFFDESLHLVSAFQVAGFRHVIGALWEVNDESCVDIAKKTYEGMRDREMTDLAVCAGLHRATRELRDRWLTTGRRRRCRRRSTPKACIHLPTKKLRSTDDEDCDGHESRVVRKIVLDDSDDANSLDEQDWKPSNWIPYVHFGP